MVLKSKEKKTKSAYYLGPLYRPTRAKRLLKGVSLVGRLWRPVYILIRDVFIICDDGDRLVSQNLSYHDEQNIYGLGWESEPF